MEFAGLPSAKFHSRYLTDAHKHFSLKDEHLNFFVEDFVFAMQRCSVA